MNIDKCYKTITIIKILRVENRLDTLKRKIESLPSNSIDSTYFKKYGKQTQNCKVDFCFTT